MTKFRNFMVELFKDESAVTAIEYGLLAALIAVVIIVAVFTAGQALNTIFTYVASCLTGATSGSGACGVAPTVTTTP